VVAAENVERPQVWKGWRRKHEQRAARKRAPATPVRRRCLTATEACREATRRVADNMVSYQWSCRSAIVYLAAAQLRLQGSVAGDSQIPKVTNRVAGMRRYTLKPLAAPLAPGGGRCSACGSARIDFFLSTNFNDSFRAAR